MRGRSHEIALGYWQGRQAQEKDNEIYGKGASYYYKYRQQDARLGRFWSVDPLAGKYPWKSPYAFAMNRLVDVVELEGLEITRSPVQYDPQSGKYKVTYYFMTKVEVAQEALLSDDEVQDVLEGAARIFSSQQAAGTPDDPLIELKVKVLDNATITTRFVGKLPKDLYGRTLYGGYTPSKERLVEIEVATQQNKVDWDVVLAHEIAHAMGLAHPWETSLKDISMQNPLFKKWVSEKEAAFRGSGGSPNLENLQAMLLSDNSEYGEMARRIFRNLMNSYQNPIEALKGSGTELTLDQRKAMLNRVGMEGSQK